MVWLPVCEIFNVRTDVDMMHATAHGCCMLTLGEKSLTSPGTRKKGAGFCITIVNIPLQGISLVEALAEAHCMYSYTLFGNPIVQTNCVGDYVLSV